MYQPVVPAGGLIGWQFLQRTYDNQLSAFKDSETTRRDTEYFRENMPNVTSASDLVSDRRLLSIALGAFGLQDDINNTFFIQKMLEEGTTDNDAFANRFADTRYRDFSAAFGLGPGEIPGALLPGFIEEVIQDFEQRSFEVAVGNQDDTLRIALAAEREFAELSSSTSTKDSRWFEILGNPPMRELFQVAFQLPDAFAQIDIDQQRDYFEENSQRLFGVSDPAEFADKEKRDSLITRYTAISQIEQNSISSSSASIALTLLS